MSTFIALWEPVYSHRRLLVRLIISGGLVGFLVWRVDLAEALETLTDVDYFFVLPALALFTLSKLVFAVRWRVMLARLGRPPIDTLFGTLLVSNMANNVLPFRLGDLVRVQVPAQRHGISRSGLTSSVFITETLLDGVTFAILGLVGLAALDVPEALDHFIWLMIGAVGTGLLLALLGAHISLPAGWRPGRWLGWLPERLQRALADVLPPFVEGLAALREPRMGGQVLVLSFVAWLMEGLMFWLFGLAFGLDLSFGSYLVIMIGANIAIALPLAPSNVGPYEVVVAEVVAFMGVGRAVAGGYAIGTHVLNILWVTVTGLIAMWALGLRVQDVLYLGTGARQPASGAGERVGGEP